ncbi:MAG: hypothetical protein WA584_17645 [Pyrinomonadaceae bacterium]
MSKVPMRDMIILLPGITGSVLEKDGKELWGLSFRALWNALPNPNAALKQLTLQGDDLYASDLGDGITATRLMPDAHFIPFFWKIDGYSAVANLINEYFEVIPGSLYNDEPANYFEFPYDWRRDNRYSARALGVFVERKLQEWRNIQSNAKVIILAHSLGGLVARYYLEVLEGWTNCRSLITFGTPHRGSVKSLEYLANGWNQYFINLTEVVRSFTSSYQLLPRYEAVEFNNQYKRVAELDIPGIDRARAENALNFYLEIDEAVERHRKDENYNRNFKVIPIVGTKQPSLQSASFDGTRLITSHEVPANFDKLLEDGDGTVPRVSATPLELSYDYLDTFFPEKHASLQNNKQILSELFERLKQMQVTTDLGAIRGPEIDLDADQASAISLDLKDLYLKDEPVIIKVGLINLSGSEDIKVEIRSKTNPLKNETYLIKNTDDGAILEIKDISPDLYQIRVSTLKAGPQSPPPVHDIFEVSSTPVVVIS